MASQAEGANAKLQQGLQQFAHQHQQGSRQQAGEVGRGLAEERVRIIGVVDQQTRHSLQSRRDIQQDLG